MDRENGRKKSKGSKDADKKTCTLPQFPLYLRMISLFSFLHFICLWMILSRWGCDGDERLALMPMLISFLWTFAVTLICLCVLSVTARFQDALAVCVANVIGNNQDHMEKKLLETMDSFENKLNKLQEIFEREHVSRHPPRPLVIQKDGFLSVKAGPSTIHSSETRTPSALDMSPIEAGSSFQNLSDNSTLDDKSKQTMADPTQVFTSECELKVGEVGSDVAASVVVTASVVEEKDSPPGEETETASEGSSAPAANPESPKKE